MPRRRLLALSALLLTMSQAVFKLAYVAMKARMGALGGAEALGAATGSLAIASLVFSLSHGGLPDRAMVQAAKSDEASGDQVGRLHGLFLLLTLLASLVVFPLLLGTHQDASMAMLFAAGALGQHVTTVTWLSLRGWGKPWLEALALFAAGLALLALCSQATAAHQVASAYAVSGALFVFVLMVALARHPMLRPSWTAPSRWLPELKKTSPFLVLGVTSLWLGSLDIVIVRLLSGGEATGQLECATLVLRTGLQVPWLIGTLVIGRWSSAPLRPRGRIVRWVLVASVLAVLAAMFAQLSEGLVAHLMGVPATSFRAALARAALFSPLQYIAVMGLPIGMSVALRESMWSVLLAFAVALALMLALGSWLGPPGVQVGHAIGYAVLALGLVRSVERARE